MPETDGFEFAKMKELVLCCAVQKQQTAIVWKLAALF